MRKAWVLALGLFVLPQASGESQTILLTGAGTLTAATALLPGFAPGALTYSAVLAQSPIAPPFTVGRFEIPTQLFTFTQGANSANVSAIFSAYTLALEGGFAFIGSDVLFNLASAQIFSGATSAPTFVAGVYASTPVGLPGLIGSSEFTIGATTVPEPSSYALMAAGLAGLGMAARRRKRVH